MNANRLINNRYALRRWLGAGGTAEVWLAEDTLARQPVAIKLLLAEHLRNEELRRRFREEVERTRGVSHPAVVKILDVATDAASQRPFIVMEYVEGGSLKTWAAQPRSVPEVCHLFMQIAAGVAAIHASGYIHRDLKPQNILISRFGQPKITDFGIARHQDDPSQTQQGIFWGSPAYASPEQIRGERPLRPTTDLYSLGVILYELLAGAPPFEGDTDRVLDAHLTQPPTDIRSLNPRVPVGLARLVHGLLAKQATQRSAQDGQGLVQLLAGVAALPAASLPRAPTRPLAPSEAPTQRHHPAARLVSPLGQPRRPKGRTVPGMVLNPSPYALPPAPMKNQVVAAPAPARPVQRAPFSYPQIVDRLLVALTAGLSAGLLGGAVGGAAGWFLRALGGGLFDELRYAATAGDGGRAIYLGMTERALHWAVANSLIAIPMGLLLAIAMVGLSQQPLPRRSLLRALGMPITALTAALGGAGRGVLLGVVALALLWGAQVASLSLPLPPPLAEGESLGGGLLRYAAYGALAWPLLRLLSAQLGDPLDALRAPRLGRAAAGAIAGALLLMLGATMEATLAGIVHRPVIELVATLLGAPLAAWRTLGGMGALGIIGAVAGALVGFTEGAPDR